ncbi:MAG TPA: alpha/beta fold hydrolase, partial [Candidatus Solibacter sp.]|nr:alpha/beta fold hydrolase [Candidatus Solibacter sp.]
AQAQAGPAGARTRPEPGIEQSAFYLAGSRGGIFCSVVAPVDGATANLVVCPPLLADFAFSYRRELVFSTEMARRGAAVWRFHYSGTGYSEGDAAGMSFSSLVADAGTVIAAASAASSAPLALMGTRCGALVAAAAGEQSRVKLVFWEPVEEGATYLREGFRARIIVDGGQLARRPPTSARMVDEITVGGSTELVGYTLHRGLYESLVGLRLVDQVASEVPGVLLVRSQADEGAALADTLAPALRDRGVAVSAATVGLAEGWWFHRMQRLPAAEVGRRLADAVWPWLEQGGPSDLNLPLSTGARLPAFIPADDQTVFGLLTPPSVPSNGVTSVILWGGAGIPSFGRNQVAAKLAQRLSLDGYHVLQLDYPGCGESPGPTQTEPIDEPAKLALFESVRSAYRWLAGKGLGRVVAIGSCQGAVAALYTATDIPSPVGLALLAAPVLEGEEICTPGSTVAGGDGAVGARFLDAMRQVVDAGIPLLLLYGTDDEVFPDFDRARQAPLRDLLLRAGDRAQVRLTDERIHGYLTVSGQQAGSDMVMEWIGALGAAAATGPAGVAPDGPTGVSDAVRDHIRATNIEAELPSDFDDQTSLLDAGVLDSLAVFKLVAFLEARFGIEIADEELAWENFETIAAVASLVESKTAGAIPDAASVR